MKLKMLCCKHEEEIDDNGDLVDYPTIEEETEETEHEYKLEDFEDLKEMVREVLRFMADSGCNEWSCSRPISEHCWISSGYELRMNGDIESTSIFFAEVSEEELAEFNRQLFPENKGAKS